MQFKILSSPSPSDCCRSVQRKPKLLKPIDNRIYFHLLCYFFQLVQRPLEINEMEMLKHDERQGSGSLRQRWWWEEVKKWNFIFKKKDWKYEAPRSLQHLTSSSFSSAPPFLLFKNGLSKTSKNTVIEGLKFTPLSWSSVCAHQQSAKQSKSGKAPDNEGINFD